MRLTIDSVSPFVPPKESFLLGGSSDDDGQDGDEAASDQSRGEDWDGEQDEEEDLVAGQMEGDGLPQSKGDQGGRRRRRSSRVFAAARGSEGVPEEEAEMEEPHREVQLPEECWVGVLRAGGVREMCVMGRVNRCEGVVVGSESVSESEDRDGRWGPMGHESLL